MLKKTLLACSTLLLPIMASANTELTSWGTSTSVSTLDDCPSYCTGNSDRASDGAVNQTTSYSELSNAAGFGKASAAIDGDGYTPSLKVYAESNANTGTWASAWGIQQYTYTGTGSATLELNLNLHGNVTGDGQIKGEVAIIKGDELPWTSDMATLVYELVDYNDVLGFETLFLHETTGDLAVGSISVELNEGDTFFVRADLLSNGKRSGIADGYNTFTMSFDDTSELVAATQPEEPTEPENSLSYEERLNIVKTLWQVAYEDYYFSRKEKRIVRKAARLLELEKGDARMLKKEVKAEAWAN